MPTRLLGLSAATMLSSCRQGCFCCGLHICSLQNINRSMQAAWLARLFHAPCLFHSAAVLHCCTYHSCLLVLDAMSACCIDLMQDSLDAVVEMKEHDVPYHIRFCIDEGVRCGHWFNVSAKVSRLHCCPDELHAQILASQGPLRITPQLVFPVVHNDTWHQGCKELWAWL